METIDLDHLASRYFSFRLSRQNRYLDFLEQELEGVRTEAEARVVLSLLRGAKQRINRLEEQFIDSCGA